MALISWLVVAYAGICAAAYFGNRLLMYIPDPARITPAKAGLEGVREIEIKVGDGVMLVAWHAPAKENQPTILYFHGNGANAANRAPKIETMRENGFGVFYLNNRGYGGSGGRPTEENNVADAITAYNYLIGLGVPASSIVAYGESLGSGQAVRLAAERPLAAIVLEAPLTSTVDVGRTTYFWLPLSLLITDKYDNERNIRSVTAPHHDHAGRQLPLFWGDPRRGQRSRGRRARRIHFGPSRTRPDRRLVPATARALRR